MGRWFWSLSLLAALAAFAWFVFETPALVSAGVAAAVACGFSIWLDRRPDARPASQVAARWPMTR